MPTHLPAARRRGAPPSVQACAQPPKAPESSLWSWEPRFATLHAAAAFGGDGMRTAFCRLPTDVWPKAAAYVMGHCDVHSRCDVVHALAREPQGAAALKAFAADPSAVVRYLVVNVADPATLVQLAHDPSDWVRLAAVTALARCADCQQHVQNIAGGEAHAGVRRGLVDALSAPKVGALHPQSLLVLCHDPEPWVRAAAWAALPHDRQAVELLKTAANDSQPPWMQHIALRELAKRDGMQAGSVFLGLAGKVTPEAYAAMGRMLTGLAPGLLRYAAHLMGSAQKGDTQWLLERLDVIQSQRPSNEQTTALWELRFWFEPHAATVDPSLARAIGDVIGRLEASTSTQSVAFSAMAQVFPEVALPALENLRVNPWPDTKARAARVLSAWKQPDAVPMLHSMLDAPGVPANEVVNALSNLLHGAKDQHEDAILAVLTEMAGKRDAKVRALLPGPVGWARSARAEDLLAIALRDPSAEVRLAAVWPAARRESAYLTHLLSHLKADPDPKVRLYLADACRLLASDPALAILRTLAGDKDETVRTKVSYTLEHHITPAGLELLETMALRDPALRQRVDQSRGTVLMDALQRHGEHQGVLTQLVRWAGQLTCLDDRVAKALVESDHPQAAAILRGLMDNSSAAVRQVATDASSAHLHKRLMPQN